MVGRPLWVGMNWVRVLAPTLIALFLLVASAMADDECTKRPDLWLPPDGTTGLAAGGISVQRVSGDVCQGDVVTITFTIDNLSCGDAGPFDVTVYYDHSGHVIDVVHIDGLPGCEYVTRSITWDTDGVPIGEHEIIICADTGGVIDELNESNNCLTIDRTVDVRPNTPLVGGEKTVELDRYEPEAIVRYEVTLWNDGCADQGNNPGHEFVDTLPDGLTPTGTPTATSGTIAFIGNQVTWNGSIPSGGVVTLRFAARIDGAVEDGTEICNEGTLRWDSDGNGTNDAESTTTSACFVVEVPVDCPPIPGTIDAPTLGEWGAIALSALFAGAFLWRLRRPAEAA